MSGCVRDAFSHSQEIFAARDPGDMALYQGGNCDDQARAITICYLGANVTVSHPGGNIIDCGWLQELTRSEHVLCFQYLSGLGALPPRPPWKSFLELPGGPHHHDLFCTDAIDPISKRFGRDVAGFKRACEQLHGQRQDVGVAAYVIDVFPKLQLLFTLHDGKNGTKANVLFDSSSIHHLSTASLFVLGIEASKRLRQAGQATALQQD